MDVTHAGELGGPQTVLGTVPYLNVQPMIWAIQKGLVGNDISLVPEVPRLLARSLYQKRFHTAIVPVYEYFNHPGYYTFLQAPVIAARQDVASVALYSSCPWMQVRRVYLDVSSFTSVHLFKVLAAEAGLHPEYVDTSAQPVPRPLPPETGWVVIGDPAIAEIGKHPYTLDLATAWLELTGLPFVFAAWLVPDGISKPGLAEVLNRSLDIGWENLEAVARDSASRFNVTPDFALQYFRRNIHYHLGSEELAGWKTFAQLCFKHKLISQLPEFRQYL